MAATIYKTLAWRLARLRALRRDGNACSVGRLLGGDCSPVLHVHHLVPLSHGGDPYALDNLLTACASHHPRLEALRRYALAERAPARCPHAHRTAEARRLCEARMNRGSRPVAA